MGLAHLTGRVRGHGSFQLSQEPFLGAPKKWVLVKKWWFAKGRKPPQNRCFLRGSKTDGFVTIPHKTGFWGGKSVNCYLENAKNSMKSVFDKGGVFGGGPPGGVPKPVFYPFSQIWVFWPKLKNSVTSPKLSIANGKRGTTDPRSASSSEQLDEDTLMRESSDVCGSLTHQSTANPM